MKNRPSLSVAACLLLLPAAATAASAPVALHGKSVVVTWNENRVQRHVGEAAFRNVSASHRLSVYLSSAGRVFSRLTNTTRSGTGSTDQVAGEAGARRVPAFNGQTMTMFLPFRAGGMRHVVVNFTAGFGDCAAKVSFARQVGAASNLAFSPISKKMVELQSITPSGVSCSVHLGNVFGGQ